MVQNCQCEVRGRLCVEQAAQRGVQRMQRVTPVDAEVPPGGQRVKADVLSATPMEEDWEKRRAADRRTCVVLTTTTSSVSCRQAARQLGWRATICSGSAMICSSSGC